MSSPRKYSSPYLSGFPGLSPSPGTGTPPTKPKKKSKTSVTKLSESAAALKQIQDGIWRTAKESGKIPVSGRINSSGDQAASPRQEDTSFDDASSCGDIQVEKILDEIKEADASELTTVVDGEKVEPEVKGNDAGEDQDADDVGELGASALVASKDSILLKQSNVKSGSKEEASDYWGVPPEDYQEDTEALEAKQPSQVPPPPMPIVLKSILKKPTIYTDKSRTKEPSHTHKKVNSKNATPKAKYGRPVKEQPHASSSRASGRQVKGTTAVLPSNLEIHNKFSNSKLPAKSPRRKSKTSGRLEAGNEVAEKTRNMPVAPKAVRFSNQIDVHPVPYEPRAGSRACDWQRNMLEQRVLTFRQLMKEVGNAEDLDLFGNSMLFPGYSSYPMPNPNFALRGTNPSGYGSGLVGLPPPGLGRARNNYNL